jgi:acetyl-CoA C-acetyltransferase
MRFSAGYDKQRDSNPIRGEVTMRDKVIIGAARTPVGSFLGSLSTVPATRLGAIAIEEAIKRAGINKEIVDEVIMGCVLPAAQGQAPARQAAIAAGIPPTTGAMTINKVCGSGMKSVMLASQAIATGDSELVVAGGMESMSLGPYLLRRARTGYRMGNDTIEDGMIKDGLWDPYENAHMGTFADLCAREKGFSREEQDAFAVESYKRSLKAQQDGEFAEEIVPVPVPQRKGKELLVDKDEEPGRVNFDKMPSLKPAFGKEGTVTAANASSINDGAGAVVVTTPEKAKELGVSPLCKIVGYAQASIEPRWFTLAPIQAVKKVFEKTGLKQDDIDIFEINEAFAVVTLAAIKEFGLDAARVNVNGGAVSLGHPIGASGARILVTLLYAMKKRDAKRGLATLCIGGGEAVAMIVER